MNAQQGISDIKVWFAAMRTEMFSIRSLLIVMSAAATTLAASGVSAQTPGLPRVLILTTGGTIASRVAAPMETGADLVAAVPELREYADVEVEEFSRIGSSQMTPSHWLALAKRINAALESDSELAGIVVTHGTDTMEETAFFLNLTVRFSRPVVLVGSMRAANEISADGPANLLNAVRVAVNRDAVGAGVLVVLNEDISAARDVWKTHNRRVDTFRSPEFGHLGVVDPDTVIFYRYTNHPHTERSEFDVRGLDSLPDVEIVADYAGFDGRALDDVVSRKPAGLVIETFAGGRMSEGARNGIRRAVAAGLPVVISSRVPDGRIIGNPAEQLGALVARDLPAHKARILLMLALTESSDRTRLQSIFDTY